MVVQYARTPILAGGAPIMRTTKVALLIGLALVLVLMGCSSVVPVTSVNAQGTYQGCRDSQGNFGQAQEYPGSYIALVDVPCQLKGIPPPIFTGGQLLDSAGKDQVVTIVTTADLHARTIRLWIGADSGALFETGINLEIIPPGGVGYKRFLREWDKHVEEHFDDTPFPVDFDIPAGSTIRLSRDPHGVISCNDAPVFNCTTQEMAQIFGG
jgi:uncharacterized protein YceK